MYGTHYSFLNVHLCVYEHNTHFKIWSFLFCVDVQLCTTAPEAVSAVQTPFKSTVHVNLHFFSFEPTLGFKKGTHTEVQTIILPPCQKVLRSLKAGATLKHVVLSPL